jgi:chromosome segregation ATPase
MNIGIEMKQLKTEIDSLRNQLVQSRRLCEDLKVSNERLKSRLGESENHLDQSRHLCGELQASNESFRTSLEENESRQKATLAELSRIKEELDQTQRIRKDLQASKDNLHNRLRESVQDGLRRLQTEFTNERSQMEEMKMVLASWGTILDARLRFISEEVERMVEATLAEIDLATKKES